MAESMCDSRAYMLEMPAEYKELSEEEKEYDGGLFGLIFTGIGIGLSIASAATGNKTLGKISNAVTVVGAVTSFGTGAVVAGVAKGAITTIGKKAGQALVDDAAVKGAQLVSWDVPGTIIGAATWS